MAHRSVSLLTLLLVAAGTGSGVPGAVAGPSEQPASGPAEAQALGSTQTLAAPTLGGELPPPLPLFPPDNWWNLDISGAPLDANSAAFISFIGPTRRLHPDFGGEASPGSEDIYGIPYIVVDAAQAKKTVTFEYWDESDGVDQATGQSFPFYPIPDEAITQAHWVEGGAPGNVDLRATSDRHILIVDRDNKHLYELWNVFYDGAGWRAGSGAFFDMNTNDRRLETWTSADAAGLAMLPGLVRYDEVYGPDEIGHALRVTLRASNGYVYPASHAAGSNPQALPMGARLRLKASKDLSSFAAPMQKVFRAMKKYGLIMADNGSDMYVTGTFDTRWNNDVLNPAFHALTAGDFEVVQRGYVPPSVSLSIDDVAVAEGNAGTTNATFGVTLSAPSSQTVSVAYATADATAVAPGDYTAVASGTLTFPPGVTTRTAAIAVKGDALDEANEAFVLLLSNPQNATLARAGGQATIVDDDGGRAAAWLPIATLPFTIGSAGNYSLVRSLSWSDAAGAAITIASDGVRLDLRGFTLDGSDAGPATQAYGVHALNRRNVTVRNGTVRGFRQGVRLDDDSGAALNSGGHVVERLAAHENREAGIWVEGGGSVVRNTVVLATGGTTASGPNADAFGIFVAGALSRVLDNDVCGVEGVGSGQAFGVRLLSGDGSVVARNRISQAAPGAAAANGIVLAGGSDVLVVENRLMDLDNGVVYAAATGPYRGNLTTGVATRFTGGTDAGNNW